MNLIAKYKINNFAYYQNLLLQHIENEKETGARWHITGEEGSQMRSRVGPLNSDLDSNVLSPYNHPTYKNLIVEMLDTPTKMYAQKFHQNAYITLISMWWTQYETSALFDWHTHSVTNLVGVIQLELESSLDATKICGYNETIEEGEIIIFPAMLPHTGAKTIGNRKTTIGLNMNMSIK